jgi:O-antigen/teichoic acid export membrane protein
VVGLVLIARLLGRRSINLRFRATTRTGRIARYAGALFIIDSAFALFSQIDALIIGAMLSARSAGLFGAPVRLLAFIEYPGLSVAAGVAPRLARSEEESPDVDAFQAGIRFLILLQLLFAAPMLVWAQPLVDLLLGSDYDESVSVMRALAPYALLGGLAPLITLGVNYLGEARRRIPLAIGAVALNAAIDVALIPQIGIVAGAIGTDVAALLYVGGHLWICRRIVALDLGTLAATLARGMLAFGGMCGVLLAFGTADLAITTLVLGGAAASLAYGLLLLASGEFSRGELRAGYAMLVDALPRRSGNA